MGPDVLPTAVAPEGAAWRGRGLAACQLGADNVVVTFLPVRTRGLRLVQTRRDWVFDWSAAELRLRTP